MSALHFGNLMREAPEYCRDEHTLVTRGDQGPIEIYYRVYLWSHKLEASKRPLNARGRERVLIQW